MMIDYFKFRELPDSRVKKLIDIAHKVREWKAMNEGIGALAMALGGQPKK